MTKTMKERFINWLKELWGQDEIMMKRIPSEKLNFGLENKKRK